jgi:hypothetical protein
MAYLPPSADEIRALIKAFWQQHPDPSKQSNATNERTNELDDQDFLDSKVAATQYLLQRFIRGGIDPQEAESRTMRSVALAE